MSRDKRPRRDLHALNERGMVLCSPRDKEAAHRAEREEIATEERPAVTCRKCLASLHERDDARMMDQTRANLDAAGVKQAIGAGLMGSGYCSEANTAGPGGDALGVAVDVRGAQPAEAVAAHSSGGGGLIEPAGPPGWAVGDRERAIEGRVERDGS